MAEHYIIVTDRGRMRALERFQEPGQSHPALRQVLAEDFVAGKQSYTDRDSDVAGRFQGSRVQGRGPGAPVARMGQSIDERLPEQREDDRRGIDDVVTGITLFLTAHPQATWDLAASREIANTILERMSPPLRQRLRKSLHKDLVNVPAPELLSHFTNA